MDALAKDEHLLNIGLHETHWGTCKGKTAKGKPCRHSVIYANGYCAQHGGVTSPEDKAAQLALVKAKLLKRIKRGRKKCQEHPSKTCSQTGSAKASIASANPAVAGSQSSPDAQVNGAVDGTAVTATNNSQRTRRNAKNPYPTYPDQRRPRAGKESSSTSKKDGEDHKSLDHKKEPESQVKELNAKAESGIPPDEGENIAGAHVHGAVALTGYSRGDRGQQWRHVGVNRLGQQLVEVPSWSALSVPRGVDNPVQAGWQSVTSPPRHLVEPKCDYDY